MDQHVIDYYLYSAYINTMQSTDYDAHVMDRMYYNMKGECYV